jgi:hypothetical protein
MRGGMGELLELPRALGHVAAERHEAAVQRPNDLVLVIELAAFSAVGEDAAKFAPGKQGRPQRAVEIRLVAARLEKRRRAADELAARISRHALAGGVHILNAAVSIRDHDGVGAVLGIAAKADIHDAFHAAARRPL